MAYEVGRGSKPHFGYGVAIARWKRTDDAMQPCFSGRMRPDCATEPIARAGSDPKGGIYDENTPIGTFSAGAW